ncbi:hypothetical protein PVK06_003696 [Gossypium arboreum]|uniref:Uncharacterized protein n=1 Tax=Gossypium arboreum TaxID=29729 RepID=A0ABR0QPX4_GOSAR|nr:hypothetical protein PVK06_003696 [Gossypium arboreum]
MLIDGKFYDLCHVQILDVLDQHPSFDESILSGVRENEGKEKVLINEDCSLKFIEITVEPKTRIMKVELFEYHNQRVETNRDIV